MNRFRYLNEALEPSIGDKVRFNPCSIYDGGSLKVYFNVRAMRGVILSSASSSQWLIDWTEPSTGKHYVNIQPKDCVIPA